MSDLINTGPGTYRHTGSYGVLNKKHLDFIIEECRCNEKKRARINYHLNDGDAVQEMIIAMHYQTSLDVHFHKAKSESFNVILGAISVVLFNDIGDVLDKINLVANTPSCFYRLNDSLPHLVIPLTDICVIHEVTEGPFIQLNSSSIPHWSKTPEAILEIDRMRSLIRLDYLNNNRKEF